MRISILFYLSCFLTFFLLFLKWYFFERISVRWKSFNIAQSFNIDDAREIFLSFADTIDLHADFIFFYGSNREIEDGKNKIII